MSALRLNSSDNHSVVFVTIVLNLKRHFQLITILANKYMWTHKGKGDERRVGGRWGERRKKGGEVRRDRVSMRRMEGDRDGGRERNDEKRYGSIVLVFRKYK